jgi:hypothetical protein
MLPRPDNVVPVRVADDHLQQDRVKRLPRGINFQESLDYHVQLDVFLEVLAPALASVFDHGRAESSGELKGVFKVGTRCTEQ